jgi:hypothetical protein
MCPTEPLQELAITKHRRFLPNVGDSLHNGENGKEPGN